MITSYKSIFYLLIICFAVFTSCSGPQEAPGNNQNLESVYISGGTEQYFLGTLPHWVNFSPWAKCHRSEAIRYMNFENIAKSYNLKYEQIVYMQIAYPTKGVKTAIIGTYLSFTCHFVNNPNA